MSDSEDETIRPSYENTNGTVVTQKSRAVVANEIAGED